MFQVSYFTLWACQKRFHLYPSPCLSYIIHQHAKLFILLFQQGFLSSCSLSYIKHWQLIITNKMLYLQFQQYFHHQLSPYPVSPCSGPPLMKNWQLIVNKVAICRAYNFNYIFAIHSLFVLPSFMNTNSKLL